jgi:hypothetical protein
MNEAENTYRILKEEPLLVTRWQCYFKIHRWSKWCRPIVSNASIWGKQWRECVGCGEYEFKRIRMD